MYRAVILITFPEGKHRYTKDPGRLTGVYVLSFTEEKTYCQYKGIAPLGVEGWTALFFISERLEDRRR